MWKLQQIDSKLFLKRLEDKFCEMISEKKKNDPSNLKLIKYIIYELN